MEELFREIQKIHPDVVCIRIMGYLEDIYLVFPPSPLEKEVGDNWSGKRHSEMSQWEFVADSPTDLWFEDLLDYLEDNTVPFGDYSF